MTPTTRPRLNSGLRTNELLSRQLASIAATLANASKRRDIATKEIASREASHEGSRSSTPMPSIRSPLSMTLVDCPLSSSRSGSTVVNDAASEESMLATAGGDHAVKETDKDAAERKEEVPPRSSPVVQLRGGDVGNEEVKSTLREFEELSGRSRAARKPLAEEEDLNSLRAEFERMLLPSPKPVNPKLAAEITQPIPPFIDGPALQRIEKDQARGSKVSQKCLYYATALQLEKAGCKWETAQGWSAYLFSAGSNGHDAVQHKKKLLDEAEEELNTLIKQVLDEESAYWTKVEKSFLPCRLIVTNIAAGADTKALVKFFSKFKSDIRNIKILERDPTSRIQTAHVDMYTREAAQQATYILGSIYGLIVKIRLAVDNK